MPKVEHHHCGDDCPNKMVYPQGQKDKCSGEGDNGDDITSLNLH
jgi:hypothetical protein